MRLVLACVLAALAGPLAAQEVTTASGGVVRWLDKVSGEIEDIEMQSGQSVTKGRLTIKLEECRYPVDDPASNAFAHLVIRDELVTDPVFAGWMIATSPALSALDHARYDVWVLRCITE